MKAQRFSGCFYALPSLIMAAVLFCVGTANAQSAALLSVQGQGMLPNQVVTLSAGAKQNLRVTASPNGSVTFSNLKYAPDNNLSFTLSYKVQGANNKIIPNDVLVELNPFTGTAYMRGNASKAASIIVNMSSEDSRAIIANQNGYFAGSVESLNSFVDNPFQLKASIINVEESCCPRSLRPYAPVSITITSQPQKKAQAKIIESYETAFIDSSIPPASYSVSVPDSLIQESWIKGVHNLSNHLVESVQRETSTLGTFMQGQMNAAGVRKLQEQQANTAKNYLPSEQLCRYGTLNQSLAASETAGKANKTAMMAALLGNEMRSANSVVGGNNSDQDKDVDYAGMIDAPFTIDTNFTSGAGSKTSDIFAMAERLFPSRPANKGPDQSGYMQNNTNFRSLQAIRSVAKNSFIAQVAEKSSGTASSYAFISKLMQSLKISDGETKILMGANPSYYAQMEVLTKKIFQDPAFYINLVDTPANVKRQKAAIRAIKLQQQNDFAQVVKRREMLLATLLELKLREREPGIEQRINPEIDRKTP